MEGSPLAAALQCILTMGYFPRVQLDRVIIKLNRALHLGRDQRLKMKSVISEAHNVFGLLEMDLVELNDDYNNGTKYMAVVSRGSFPEFLNNMMMPQSQAVKFKDLVDKMFQNDRCNGLNNRDLPLSEFPVREELIGGLAENNWIVVENPHQINLRRIYPSMRLLYEFEPYLKENFAGITLHKCLGCLKWLLRGKLCSNKECSARLHDGCYDAYFNLNTGEVKGTCPKCASKI